MADTAANNSRMLKDTVLYMIAKSVEGIAGILTISRLSYIFPKADLGRFNLWNITATTLAMLSIQWLSQSASRYLNDYEHRNDSTTFYSTVFSGWLKINLCAVALFALTGVLLSGVTVNTAPGIISFMFGGGAEGGRFLLYMFILAGVYFVTYNTSQLLIALLSVKRKVYANLLISAASSVGKLVLILIFSQVIGPVIWIVFLSYIISDFLVIVFALCILAVIKNIKRKSASRELMSGFGKYGLPLVGNLATTTVLNNSDRYIIGNSVGEAGVGEYTTSYSVVSSVFTMLQTALMRGSYPTILKTYAQGDKELTEKLVSQAVRNYMLLAVPAVVGIGVLAKPLAALLFHPDYIEGYRVMVWVAAGMALLGLTEYSNKPWELSAKTHFIFKNSLIGGMVNLLINIVFVPRYGYMTAAYSTFLGFFIYFMLSKLGSRKLMKWQLGVKTYVSIIGSSLLMGICLIAAVSFLGVTKLTLTAYVLAGVFVYGLALMMTGEVNEEKTMAKIFLKNRGLIK